MQLSVPMTSFAAAGLKGDNMGMALFRKVQEKEIGSCPISLAVVESGDGVIVGRIIAPTIDQAVTTYPYDPPIEAAISIAERLAKAHNVTVEVYDPLDRWQSSWGDLVR